MRAWACVWVCGARVALVTRTTAWTDDSVETGLPYCQLHTPKVGEVAQDCFSLNNHADICDYKTCSFFLSCLVISFASFRKTDEHYFGN